MLPGDLVYLEQEDGIELGIVLDCYAGPNVGVYVVEWATPILWCRMEDLRIIGRVYEDES